VNFTAIRTNVPQLDLDELDTLHVTVVGRSFEQEMMDRSKTSTDLEIDVAVQRKVAGVGPVDCDPLADLVESIIAYFKRRQLETYPNAVWMKTRNPVLYIPEHLDEKVLFTSVITLTYRVVV